MTQYLLAMYQPDGPIPSAEVLEQVMADLGEVNKRITDAGSWVFSGGLFPPSSATVVRFGEGETFVTDGPFAEGKEHLGGFWIIDAPDLDAALGWGKEITTITTLPIEVRPFQSR
jgi:hypothetical protein